MKILKIILIKIGFLIFFLSFILSCEKERIPINYKALSLKTIKEGLESPGGLSENPNSESEFSTRSAKGVDDLEGILVDGPSYKNLYSDGGIQPLENPKILRISEGPGEIFDLSEIVQIDINSFSEDFDSYTYYPTSPRKLGDTLWRAAGLTLDGLILKDGGILISSNSSDKLFAVSEGKTTFFQKSELYGIIDMILGTDAKIYALKIDTANSYSKEVISIENETINTEFELPKGHYDLGNKTQFIEKLKIFENSPSGKEKFGTAFYVSDLLKNVIYKVNTNNDVEILSENLNYPSSLTVDSHGFVFYTTTPIIYYSYPIKLSRPTKLCYINPETGISREVYTFDENVNDYYPSENLWGANYTGGLFPLDGSDHMDGNICIPIGYNVTTILRERGDTLEFLVTNSHQGTLKYLSILRQDGD